MNIVKVDDAPTMNLEEAKSYVEWWNKTTICRHMILDTPAGVELYRIELTYQEHDLLVRLGLCS